MAAPQSTQSDEELARQSQAGALAAFEELVFRYEARLYAFALRLCANEFAAREITQDTFVKAYQSIHQYRSPYAFAGWLFTIARHKCIDHYRATPQERELPAELPAGAGPDPSEQLAAREQRDQLWQLARRHLPPAQFEALWLKYGEDLRVDDIARVLGKTRTHTKVLLFRARQALGRELERTMPAHRRSAATEPRPAAGGKPRQPQPATTA